MSKEGKGRRMIDQIFPYMGELNACMKEVSAQMGTKDVSEIMRRISSGEWMVMPYFDRNEHGHIVFTITGLNLTGAQESERLEAAGVYVSELAGPCLTSTNVDSYDKCHRLVDGKQYKIVLMPTREVEVESNRTIEALRKHGIEKYGYTKPLAGIVPRIRELLSDAQIQRMGFCDIIAPHDPIIGRAVLRASCGDDKPWLCVGWDMSDSRWHDVAACAFFVSERPSIPFTDDL